MAGLFNKVQSISLPAGADYSQPGVGEYRFAIVNPSTETGAGPSNPGLWYGSAADDTITVPKGNAFVNTTAGGNCDIIIVGKALLGQPIECAFPGSGVVPVVTGAGGVTAGEAVMSDNAGAVVAHTGSNHILGTALQDAAQDELCEIRFQPRGEA